jgi:predicted aspartyl protease
MYQVSRRWMPALFLGLWLVPACSAPPPTRAPLKTTGTTLPAIASPQSPAAKPAVKPAVPTSGPKSNLKPGSKANPVVTKPDPKVPPPESYSRALDKAESAQNIALTARSRDDWNLVASQWQQAVQLMRSVPAAHAYHKRAQTKLVGYQRSLANAKSRSVQANNQGDNPVDPRIGADPVGQAPAGIALGSGGPSRPVQAFQAIIKRRSGGTPVIDVTFNGRQTFEMIVDTGAGGTVVTPRMAAALGLTVVGRTRVNTASQRGVEVELAYVESMAVGPAQVNGVTVAIGGEALEVGLLGHDFFDRYDVTIKRDVVEFRGRS